MVLFQLFFILGCAFACIGVAAGAFGAHSLKATLGSEMLAVFETAVRYQMYHAFGLMVVAWAGQWSPRRSSPGFTAWAGWLFVSGIALFSGSLYLMALSGTRWIGIFTPLGGLAFLTGWVLLAWSVLKSKG
jgi:uncharacterized membrane protein YgdD (TMEM256/DUF423 family)